MLLLKLCLEVRKGAYFLQSDFHRMECMSALLNGMLNAQGNTLEAINKNSWNGGMGVLVAEMGGVDSRWAGYSRQVLSHAGMGLCRGLFVWLPFAVELEPSKLCGS